MSREEHLRELVRQGQALRQEDIDLGAKRERERIRANILTRVTDLNCCTKRDNCNELARLIESYIKEWLDGESE